MQLTINHKTYCKMAFKSEPSINKPSINEANTRVSESEQVRMRVSVSDMERA